MRVVHSITMWQDSAVRERVRALVTGWRGCAFEFGSLVVDEAVGDVDAVLSALRSMGFINAAGVARGEFGVVRGPLFRVCRQREFCEADRVAAAWLWYARGFESLIVGELARRPDGGLRGRDVRVRRSAHVMGRDDCELIVTEAVREHAERVGLRGIEWREAVVESWREGIGRRCRLWEVVPRRELPRMPAGAVRRSERDGTRESERHPEGGRFGEIYEPGFSNGVLVSSRSALDAIADVDIASTWEHEWEEEHSPFLVVSQRFYQEVLRRFGADGDCRPVRVIEESVSGLAQSGAAGLASAAPHAEEEC